MKPIITLTALKRILRQNCVTLSTCLTLIGGFFAEAKVAVELKLSPFNSRRPIISSNQITSIVLHQTQALYPGTLNALQKRGAAHYLVIRSGKVFQLMDLNRVATHAGISMWDDSSNLNTSSIGIEVEGFLEAPNLAQRASLKVLISELRTRFRLSPDKVVTHSMVAYQKPNKYWSQNVRGRKRCGMEMQRPDVRQDLGLTDRARLDPNVMASQVGIGDVPLFAYLFHDSATKAVFPEQNVLKLGNDVPLARRLVEDLQIPSSALPYRSNFRRLKPIASTIERRPRPPGDIITNPSASAQSEEDEIEFLQTDEENRDAYEIAGLQADEATTIYFFPRGTIRTGKELALRPWPADLRNLPVGTKVLIGYVYGGKVTRERSAWSITKSRWNDPSTIYRFPNQTIRTGDDVNPDAVAEQTIVLFRK